MLNTNPGSGSGSDPSPFEDISISDIKTSPTYSNLAPGFKQIIDELPDHVQFLCSLKVDALSSYVDFYLVADPEGKSLKELKSRGRFNETWSEITFKNEMEQIIEDSFGSVSEAFPFKIFFIKNNDGDNIKSVTAVPSQSFSELKPKLKAIFAGILFQIFECSELVLKFLFKMDLKIEKVELVSLEDILENSDKEAFKDLIPNKIKILAKSPKVVGTSLMGLPLPLPKHSEYKPFEIPWLNKPYENN